MKNNVQKQIAKKGRARQPQLQLQLQSSGSQINNAGSDSRGNTTQRYPVKRGSTVQIQSNVYRSDRFFVPYSASLAYLPSTRHASSYLYSKISS